LYRSASYLEDFYTRICACAGEITNDYEIIFVNDGSPDNSLDIAMSLYERYDRVRIIDLSRNFGHHKAIMTGLAHAKGALVFLIDSDLEEEPELLRKFYDKLKNSDADVVYGMQETRKGSFIERITGSIFYRMINLLSSHPVPANLLTVRLMSRRYTASLVQHKDREIFLAGLWIITGYKQKPVFVNKTHKGSTTYGFGRKVANLVNAVTSFSNKPLVFIFYLGCMISLISGIAALYLIVRRVLFGIYLAGWPSLIVSIWLLSGIMIWCLGVIGIYLSKIFTETKHRPYTVIRQIYERTNKA
jgi:putative glycosyltransferase